MTTKYRLNWRNATGKTGYDQPDFASRERAEGVAGVLNAHNCFEHYWVEPVEVEEEEQCSAEERQCDVCGEIWVDTGEPACPFCGSGDTNPVEEEQCNPD